MFFIIQKFNIYIIYPPLLKRTTIGKETQLLNASFEEDVKNFKLSHINVKDSSEKLIKFLNTIEKYILNQKDKENLVLLIKNLKEQVNKNINELEKQEPNINSFRNYLSMFLRYVLEIVES